MSISPTTIIVTTTVVNISGLGERVRRSGEIKRSTGKKINGLNGKTAKSESSMTETIGMMITS
jgi:hypothetical protein